MKTAGNGAFERIQSNRFTESTRKNNYEEEECPISLNYYDCKETENCKFLAVLMGLQFMATETLVIHGSRRKIRCGNGENYQLMKQNSQ